MFRDDYQAIGSGEEDGEAGMSVEHGKLENLEAFEKPVGNDKYIRALYSRETTVVMSFNQTSKLFRFPKRARTAKLFSLSPFITDTLGDPFPFGIDLASNSD